MDYDQGIVKRRSRVSPDEVIFSTIAALATYSGPGDIVTFTAWGGLRAYNAAYATGSNPAIDIVKTSDGTAQMTINILSTGFLDVATISGLGYGVSVKKLYDQTGNGHHWAQATLATMPTITLSALGSLPMMTFSGSQYLTNPSPPGGVSQPYSTSFVAERTGNTSAFSTVLGDTLFSALSGFANATNTLVAYAGNVATQGSNADNAYHAAQMIFSGTSSTIHSDGVSSTVDAGTQGNDYSNVGTVANGANNLVGNVGEVGFFTGALSVPNLSALNSNQHGTSGWNF